MEVSQIGLARMLLTSFCCGCILGALYDLVRALHSLLDGRLTNGQRSFMKRTKPPSCLALLHRPISRHSLSTIRAGVRRTANIAFSVLSDALMGLASAVVAVCMLYQTNDGQLRLSALALLFAGALFYLKTVGKVTSVFWGTSTLLIGRLLEWSALIALAPLRFIARFLWRISKPLRIRAAAWRRALACHLNRIKTQAKEKIKCKLAEPPQTVISHIPQNDEHYFCKGASCQKPK